jgi:hypothetical protein
MFAMWDAYRDAGGRKIVPISYLPFVLPAFDGTVGVAYSSQLTVAGILLDPMWLPMILAFVGVGIGLVLRKFLVR